jgi:hypothetical protein
MFKRTTTTWHKIEVDNKKKSEAKIPKENTTLQNIWITSKKQETRPTTKQHVNTQHKLAAELDTTTQTQETSSTTDCKTQKNHTKQYAENTMTKQQL